MKDKSLDIDGKVQSEARKNAQGRALLTAFLWACPFAFILGWEMPDLENGELGRLMLKCLIMWAILAAVFCARVYKKMYRKTIEIHERRQAIEKRNADRKAHTAARSAASKPGLLRCPHCNVLMHRPSGFGRVRIHCPNPDCGNCFETTL